MFVVKYIVFQIYGQMYGSINWYSSNSTVLIEP